MLNTVYRLLLTFNATSLMVIVYLVQKGYTLGVFASSSPWWHGLAVVTTCLLYFLIPLLLTWISIFLSSKLGKDEFKAGNVASLEHANNSFLPSYLGYFFVALSATSWESLWFVYCIVFIFTYLSQALYFNPLFLVFGYDFYNIKTNNGTAIFLISKKKYKKPSDVASDVAYRINNHTFIDRGTDGSDTSQS